MTLQRYDEIPINKLTYEIVWRYAHSTSCSDEPRDPTYRCYHCSPVDLLAARTHPVWFTDQARQEFVNYNHPDAKPITFAQLVPIKHLREEKLSQLGHGVNPNAPLWLLVEHCAVCEVRVVKDGCKRLLLRAHVESPCRVEVVEVSGSDWSGCRYDMSKLCGCVGTA